MKFLLKMIISMVFMAFMVLLFLPKKNLYFFAETFLEKQKIIFYDEKVTQKPFGLFIEEAKMNFQGIHAGKIESVSAEIYLFYDVLKIKNAQFVQEVSQFVPNQIKDITLKYTLLSPLKVSVSSQGDFGVLRGGFYFLKRELVLWLEPSNVMKSRYKNLLKKFKQVDGKYVYRASF